MYNTLSFYLYIRHRASAREREQCLSWGPGLRIQGWGSRAAPWILGCFFRDNQSPAQLWFEGFFSLKIAMFFKTANVRPFAPKWPKSHPKPFQNGVKWAPKSTFSAACRKSDFLDST